MTISPTPASGSLLRWAPNPKGPIRKIDLAPLLSAQLRTAPTGRPRVMRNFVPDAPPPIPRLRCIASIRMYKRIWWEGTKNRDRNGQHCVYYWECDAYHELQPFCRDLSDLNVSVLATTVIIIKVRQPTSAVWNCTVSGQMPDLNHAN